MATLASLLGARAFARTGTKPGGGNYAAMNLTDRLQAGVGLFPFDIDANARPGVNSAAAATALSNAIEKMALSGEAQNFEAGTYFIDRSYSPSADSSNAAMSGRTVRFNDTTFQPQSGVAVTNFNEHIGEAGGAHLINEIASGNLPTPENIYCLVDLTNTRNSQYFGKVSFDGGGATTRKGLCALGSSQKAYKDAGFTASPAESGGGSSVWNCYMTFKNIDYGLFGCPRYQSNRVFYHDTFVGCTFNRMKFFDTVDTPILVASNTFDDAWIDTLAIITKNPAGAAVSKAYIFGTEMCVGNIFSMGQPNSYLFDLEKATLSFSKLYHEDRIPSGTDPLANLACEAAINIRNNAWAQGILKYGESSNIVKKAMVYFSGITGGGDFRCATNSKLGSGTGMVKLRAMSGAKRKVSVKTHYTDAEIFPFITEANGSIISSGDQLTSGNADSALAKWEHFRIGDGAGAVAGTGGMRKLVPSWIAA